MEWEEINENELDESYQLEYPKGLTYSHELENSIDDRE